MRLTLLTAVVALALGAGTARAAEIGIGAFGGVSIPIVNDLSKPGGQFGVRVPVNVLPLLTVEPYFASSGLGEVEETFGALSYTRDGGSVRAFGLNALFTFGSPGFRLFPYVGLGSHTLEREGAEDISEIGYNFGLGLGFSPVPKFSFSLRGEFNMIATGETSQKFANITAGASYSLFSVP